LGTTVASNPGRLRVDWKKYFASSVEGWSIYVIGILVPVVLLIAFARDKIHPVFVIVGAALGLLYFLGIEVLAAKRQFWSGDVCPAVVISTRPYLIAVAADLTTGKGSFPAIKIVKHYGLSRMTGGPPDLGDRLATVATYSGGLNASRWRDFKPVVVNCVTADTGEIDRIFRSIPDRDWEMLDRGVAQMGGRTKPGTLFMIEAP
jgi:hypothetical protein